MSRITSIQESTLACYMFYDDQMDVPAACQRPRAYPSAVI